MFGLKKIKVKNKRKSLSDKYKLSLSMKIMLLMSMLSLALILGVDFMVSAIEYHNITTLAANFEHNVVSSTGNVYKNAYILENNSDVLDFYYDGQAYSLEALSNIDGEISGRIADIAIENNIITEIYIKSATLNGKILSSDEEGIEIESYEKLEYDDEFKIYHTSGDSVYCKDSISWINLFEEAVVVIENEKIQAVITCFNEEQFIDVLITTTNFESNYHESVTLVTEGSFEVLFSDGSYYTAALKKNSDISSEEVIENEEDFSDFNLVNYYDDNNVKLTEATISMETFKEKFSTKLRDYVELSDEEKEMDENYIIVRPIDGKIGISGIKRNGEVPYYRGEFVIRFSENGLLLINSLPLEEYLYGVVPSEMPAYYPEEAIKAQAVCARSYAYVQMEGSYFRKYGADVDDSINCQVYNNQQESEAVNACVDATSGQVVKYEGEILKTYYYSTSCGSSALPSDVWGGEYLSGYGNGLLSKQRVGQDKVINIEEINDSEIINSEDDYFNTETGNDLLEDTLISNYSGINISDEDKFTDFIKNNRISYEVDGATVTEIFSSYEGEASWYRWSAEISISKFEDIIKSNLTDVISSYSDKATALKNGEEINARNAELGKLEKVTITGRAESGIITEITITGSESTYVIKYQSAIRKLLSYSDLKIFLADGSERTGLSLLPSAFFTIECEEGVYKIYGGGYGHGVGMSQEGAGKMAEEGFDYLKILNTYFDGSEVKYNQS